jgi:phosphatidyl-myo-inositol alpha-mannosyltransferase
VKVGIVVPFSWSYWGGVVEHAENQARTLMELGHEARLVMANDPPGIASRLLHPRPGRHGEPPPYVIPVGRTVIVPANSSLSNVCLTPQSIVRMRRAFRRERFDVVHVHEPLVPIISLCALEAAPCPLVVTCHAAGGRWWQWGPRFWGSLIRRIDYRIAVSEQARGVAERWIGGPFEVIPNGVALPERPPIGGRDHTVVFLGRHEPRKGLPVLLRAWPDVHRRTGARLRLMGADPLAARFLLRRLAVADDGIDILGVVTAEVRDAELARAKLLIAPATGSESFGMVLTEAFAAATPVVASDIPGYREVATPDAGVLVPPDDVGALTESIVSLLDDEPRRAAFGGRAREIAEERYSWQRIVRRQLEIYAELTATQVGTEVFAA